MLLSRSYRAQTKVYATSRLSSIFAACETGNLYAGGRRCYIQRGHNLREEMSMANRKAIIETNKGTITAELYEDKAPITSANFIDLIDRGFYNGLKFHRYEPGFVIQGGDPRGNGTGDFTDPQTGRKRTIKLEVTPELKHGDAGALAMARSSDPNSASCQFYITLGPAAFLDMNYAVFGRVVEGLDVAKQLRAGDSMTSVTLTT